MQNYHYERYNKEELSAMLKTSKFTPNISAFGFSARHNASTVESPVKHISLKRSSSSEPDLSLGPSTKRIYNNENFQKTDQAWNVQPVRGRRVLNVDKFVAEKVIIENKKVELDDESLNEQAEISCQNEQPHLIPTFAVMETNDPRK